MQKRLGWQGVLGLGLMLGLASACSDDDEPEARGDAGPRADAGGDAGSGGRNDAGQDDGEDDGEPEQDGSTSTPDAGDAGGGTIVDVAVANGSFTQLAAALTRVGLVDTLRGPGPFTVFAPTDAAFAALPPGTLDGLTDEQLTTILTYHAVAGRVSSTQLEAGPVDSLAELSLFVNLTGGVKINDANVSMADVQASNGVIHVIDKVLLPPNIVQMAGFAGFTQLTGAVQTAGLTDALSDVSAQLTVLAPTDAAFNALPPGTVAGLSQAELADVLQYHVLPEQVLSTALTAGAVPTLLSGQSVTIALNPPRVNDANITVADVRVTNGVIHAIDAVLLPPAN